MYNSAGQEIEDVKGGGEGEGRGEKERRNRLKK
jgi:hypothetical protein